MAALQLGGKKYGDGILQANTQKKRPTTFFFGKISWGQGNMPQRQRATQQQQQQHRPLPQQPQQDKKNGFIGERFLKPPKPKCQPQVVSRKIKRKKGKRRMITKKWNHSRRSVLWVASGLFVSILLLHQVILVVRYHDDMSDHHQDDHSVPPETKKSKKNKNNNTVATLDGSPRPGSHHGIKAKREEEEKVSRTPTTLATSSSSQASSSVVAAASTSVFLSSLRECVSNYNKNQQKPSSSKSIEEECYMKSIDSLPQFPSLEDQPQSNMTVPIQVFILLGQSNMVGQGMINSPDSKKKYVGGTLYRAVQKKQKYLHLLEKRQYSPASNWSSLRNVRYIHMQSNVNDTLHIRVNETLTVNESRNKIGPEIQIGHVLSQLYPSTQPILLLKACIGSRSLGWDLLPPNSKRYYSYNGNKTYIHAGYHDLRQRWTYQKRKAKAKRAMVDHVDYLKNLPPEPPDPSPSQLQPKQQGTMKDGMGDDDEEKSNSARPDWYGGKQYDLDLASIRYVLKNLNQFYPNEDTANLQYNIQGLFYWQGLNDCIHPIYALRYEYNLYNFIQQLRHDLSIPKGKVVIATTAFQQNNVKLQNNIYFQQVTQAQLTIGNHMYSSNKDDDDDDDDDGNSIRQRQHKMSSNTTTAATTMPATTSARTMSLLNGPIPITSSRPSKVWPYYPKFINNVQTVDTRPYHRPNGPHATSWRHYYQNAGFVMDVGHVMGMAMIQLLHL